MPLKLCLCIVLLSVAVLSGCATNPATGAPELVLMSEKKEIRDWRQDAPRGSGEKRSAA